MRLWLLRPVGFQYELGTGQAAHYAEALQDGPWDPWYDKTFGFIVRAETAERARVIADDYPMNEARPRYHKNAEGDGDQPTWTDAALVDCTELVADGEEAIIMRDDAYA